MAFDASLKREFSGSNITCGARFLVYRRAMRGRRQALEGPVEPLSSGTANDGGNYLIVRVADPSGQIPELTPNALGLPATYQGVCGINRLGVPDYCLLKTASISRRYRGQGHNAFPSVCQAIIWRYQRRQVD